MIPGQMERKVVDLESEGRSLMQPIDKLEKMISGDPFTEVRVYLRQFEPSLNTKRRCAPQG
jgi:hypothetical protein